MILDLLLLLQLFAAMDVVGPSFGQLVDGIRSLTRTYRGARIFFALAIRPTSDSLLKTLSLSLSPSLCARMTAFEVRCFLGSRLIID
jgi:hypothetical protein